MRLPTPLTIALLMLGAPGCPGEMDLSNMPPGHVDGGANPYAYADASTVSAPTPDFGGLPASDSGAPGSDSLAAADQMLADTLAPQPDTGTPGAGQPCPCTGNLVCINGACRAKCTTPTDACGVVSTCPADHACLKTTGGFSVCVPATAQPGAACGASNYCPVNYVCGSTTGTSYSCLPICTGPGTACGTGGTCAQATNGCTFCSSI